MQLLSINFHPDLIEPLVQKILCNLQVYTTHLKRPSSVNYVFFRDPVFGPYSVKLYKGDNFYDFLFVSLQTKPLLKMCQL